MYSNEPGGEEVSMIWVIQCHSQLPHTFFSSTLEFGGRFFM